MTPLMLKDLVDIPGKEVLMITVEYPPGGADPVHRHDAHASFTCWRARRDAGHRRRGGDPYARDRRLTGS